MLRKQNGPSNSSELGPPVDPARNKEFPTGSVSLAGS